MPLCQIGKSAYLLIKSSKSFSQPGAYVCRSPVSTATTPGIIHFPAYGYVFINVVKRVSPSFGLALQLVKVFDRNPYQNKKFSVAEQNELCRERGQEVVLDLCLDCASKC